MSIKLEILDDEEKPGIKRHFSEKEFVLDWHKMFGWKSNPFHNEIINPNEKHFVGMTDEKELLNLFFLKNYKYGIIVGEEGTGKSALLRWLYKKLKSYKNKYYIVQLNTKKIKNNRDVISAIARSINTPLENIIGSHLKINESNINYLITKKCKQKDLVLLIDDIDMMQKNHRDLIKVILDHASVKAIVTCEKTKDIEFIKPDLKIKLDGFDDEETKEFILTRIKESGGTDIFPFNNEIIKKVYSKSKGNQKMILDICNEVAMKLAVKIKQDPEFRKELEEQRALELEKEKEIQDKKKERKDEEERLKKAREEKLKKIQEENEKKKQQLRMELELQKQQELELIKKNKKLNPIEELAIEKQISEIYNRIPEENLSTESVKIDDEKQEEKTKRRTKTEIMFDEIDVEKTIQELKKLAEESKK